MGFWFGFDTGFDIMQVFVFAIFAIVIVCFIALAVKGIGTWHKTAITTAVCTPAPPLTIT